MIENSFALAIEFDWSFIKRSKTDAHDARAICEAASRPDMRFVPIKRLMQHTARQLLVEQRMAVFNCCALTWRSFGVCGNHHGPASVSLQKQAGHMSAIASVRH
jgi:transposase